MTEALTIASLIIAASTVVVSVVIARWGWTRDQRHRDLASRAECAKALTRLIQARTAPLTDPTWTSVTATAANLHHIEALAAMAGMSAQRRDDRVVRFFADQSFALQEESVQYVVSGDMQRDRVENKIGPRLGGLLSAAAQLQDDVIVWQDLGTTEHTQSFWSHYASQLLRLTPRPTS
ncbi:hypothetical protein [Microbacterium murale]|uniref:Secreted protein n=1 Tax=Microbacterium murale TaxID=1081040 RepID=A0ABU0PE54_9MICO|nr:hypothetical protein [Microbacterium murale]MDQ0645604.1 hypothetical protein [Microbacterium murale]